MPTILCIEDDLDNMILVRRILQSENYTLLEARNGMQGLKIAESHDLNLILLDINLPDINGYEVARRLRSNTKRDLTSIPIIAVTGNAMRGDVHKALSVGCNMHISKPINVQKFVESIGSFVKPPITLN